MIDSSNPSWIALHSNVLLAVMLSAVFHIASAYSYWVYQQSFSKTSTLTEERPLKITFTTVVSPTPIPEAPPETKVTPEVTPDVEPEVKPEPVVKEITVPEPQPKAVEPKIVKQTVKPKPVIEEQKPAKKVTPPKPRPAQVENKPTKTLAAKPVIVVEDTPSVLEIEEQYITRLLSQIEKNKFYPRKARRRNIEGTVKVTLSINADGRIAKLSLTEGHKILRIAAEKAIKKSQPFPEPPLSLTSSKTFSFGISYRFKEN